jgi:hypothetical protein
MRTKGQVDNWNHYKQKSLNKCTRQRELLRVSHENQAILRRISSKEPYYNHLAWDDEWNQNLVYMSNISNYPRKKPRSRKSSRQTKTENQYRY